MDHFATSSNIKAPLIIGVAGHRDLRDEDIEELGKSVRSVLDELRGLVPSTPFLILSSLEDGADRLVSKIALDFGARFIVPLAMPIPQYELDFQLQESREEFYSLHAHPDERPEVVFFGYSEELIRQGRGNRQYQEVGKFIAAESQILLALWDGELADLTDFTAQIVHFQTEGVPTEDGCDIDPPERFPVYHILTPRKKNPYPAGTPFAVEKKYPKAFAHDEDFAKRYYNGMFKSLDEFNRRVQQPGKRLLAEVIKSKGHLFAKPDEAPLDARQSIMFQRYAFADALARHFQNCTQGIQISLHTLVWISFGCLAGYAHLDPEYRHYWLVASMIALGAAICVESIAKWLSVHRNYQDYRAVTEGLRIKLFWDLAGITDRITDYYLRQQRTELDWVRNGLRGWHLEWASGDKTSNPRCPSAVDLEFILKFWVQKQLEYFSAAAESVRRKANRCEILLWLMLFVTACGGLVILRAEITNWAAPPKPPHVDYALVLIDAAIAAAALIHHYSDRMAFTELSKQYVRMAGIFNNAYMGIKRSLENEDTRTATDCLRKLGQEALAENGDWILLHRERPLEFPPP